MPSRETRLIRALTAMGEKPRRLKRMSLSQLKELYEQRSGTVRTPARV